MSGIIPDNIILNNFVQSAISTNNLNHLYEFLYFAVKKIPDLNYYNIDVKNEKYWHLLGIVNYNNKDYNKAIDSFKKALFLNPGFEESNLYYGDCLSQINNFNEALIFYRKTLRINPDNIYALTALRVYIILIK